MWFKGLICKNLTYFAFPASIGFAASSRRSLCFAVFKSKPDRSLFCRRRTPLRI